MRKFGGLDVPESEDVYRGGAGPRSRLLCGGRAALVCGDLPRFAAYLLLAIPASCLKVPLPGITGTMSVLFLFLLAGTVELGFGETIVIGAASVIVQSFWHARVRPRRSTDRI